MKATEDLLSVLIPISIVCLGAPNMYDIVDLGCISDGQCYAMVINESGQVAGYGDAPNGMSTHGFVWMEANWYTSSRSTIPMEDKYGPTESMTREMWLDIPAMVGSQFTRTCGMANRW